MKTSISEKAKVGVMLCGHKEYWPQFPGMKEELIAQGMELVGWIKETGVDVAASPFVDTLEDAYKAGVEMKSKDIDLLFVYLTTYVASGRYVQGALAAGCPIVIVAGQMAFDITSGGDISIKALTSSSGPCPLPESYNAFTRCGKKPAGIIFGKFNKNDGYMINELNGWCAAANAVHAFKGSIFGYMGHSYEGMLDMNFDPTAVTKEVGAHVRFVEMCELVKYIEECTDDELNAKLEQIDSTFERMDKSYDRVTKDIEESDVVWAAKVSVGLDKLVKNNNLSGFAYYYMGEDNSIYERTASNLMIGNSLMTTNGISMAGEGDMKTCLAMYLTSALGCGGSFAELCFVDFNYDILLVGHDGPHDIRISDKKPTIRGLSLMHGKKGYGVSVEFSIKHGPMTMVAMSCDENGKYRLIYAEGESREGWVPQVGNTMTRGYFGKDVAKFIRDWTMAGTTHHASLAIGHCGDMIEKFGKLMGIEVIKVR